MKKTIGEEVDKQVKEAIDTYTYFRNCDNIELRVRALTLARHDALVLSIVSRMVMERLDKELPLNGEVA